MGLNHDKPEGMDQELWELLHRQHLVAVRRYGLACERCEAEGPDGELARLARLLNKPTHAMDGVMVTRRRFDAWSLFGKTYVGRVT